ncbi:MAG TPA: chloride channel protein [Planctomycetota bacterium]|nr:chloride channel protein [Planctomycetota bacterium]
MRLLEHALIGGWLFNPAQSGYGYWPLFVIPALGGGLAGFLAMWLAPEATGHGTDFVRAFHREKGEIRAHVPLVKGLCAALTIGSGGSAGKEGPIAQIGAGFGSTLATLLHLSVRDRRILMLAGVAGGIGAIFKAPLGGALFAAEVLYREPDFESDAVIPGVISSVTAYSVFTSIDGHARILDFKDSHGVPLPPLTFPSADGNSAAELIHYAVLSVLCALVAFLFVKGIKLIEERFFKPLPVPRAAKPAVGGMLLGLMALGLMFVVGQIANGVELGTSQPHHIMAGGQRYLQTVINSALDFTRVDPELSLKMAGFLGVVVLAKIIATGMTIGSGGSGGLLFPALFLGGITGAGYAKLCRALNDAGWMYSFFALTPNARAGMILVGMGGVFAACTKTPIASLVMVSEITGSYGLAVPLMMTCASAYILSRSFTLNEEQVPSIGDSPAHRGDFLVNVLAEIRVKDAVSGQTPPEMFTADTPFTKVLERIKGSAATVFPIVDEKQCLVGIFSLGDIRQIMNEQSVGTLVVAGDLGTMNVMSVTMETNLNEALRLFTKKSLDEIPIVESLSKNDDASRSTISAAIRRPRGPVGTLRVVGMLSRRDLIAAYQRRINEMQRADAMENSGSRVFVDALASTPTAPPVLEEAVVVNDASNPGSEILDEPPETPSEGTS